jgi:hypothetical protein
VISTYFLEIDFPTDDITENQSTMTHDEKIISLITFPQFQVKPQKM